YRILRRQPTLMQETDEATRAIAAVFCLAAVRVVDAVTEVGIGYRGGFGDDDLVGAHAQMTMCQHADAFGGELERLVHTVEHHEVVAGPVHFGEVDQHVASLFVGWILACEDQSYRSGHPSGWVLKR